MQGHEHKIPLEKDNDKRKEKAIVQVATWKVPLVKVKCSLGLRY